MTRRDLAELISMLAILICVFADFYLLDFEDGQR